MSEGILRQRHIRYLQLTVHESNVIKMMGIRNVKERIFDVLSKFVQCKTEDLNPSFIPQMPKAFPSHNLTQKWFSVA